MICLLIKVPQPRLDSTTNSQGQTITSTQQITIIVGPSGASNSTAGVGSGGSSSHTGAIVGGVVGGIGGLAILLILGWYLLKRHNKYKDDFDGDFDPDRVIGGRSSGAGLDLAAGDAAPQVTPYSYSPNPQMAMAQNNSSSVLGPGAAGVGAAGLGAAIGAGAAGASSRHGPPTSAPSAYSQPSQSQYGGSSSSEAGGAAHRTSDYNNAYAAYADGGESEAGMSSPRGAGGYYTGDWRGPSPGPSVPSAATTGTLPSHKELEARGLRVRNERGEDDDGPVVQHTDGGRIPEEGEATTPPREVPPSYDSIRD